MTDAVERRDKRRLTRLVIDQTRLSVRLVRNVVMSAFSRPDYERWQSPGGLEEWWDERTQALAQFIPDGSTVIEFGAGRRQLEKFLPPACTYIPSDLTDRGPGTLVCDINKRPLPSLAHLAPDVAVFSGVFEYVKEVQAVVNWLRESGVTTIVCSFDAMPTPMDWRSRLAERRRRVYCGYMNNLTANEFKETFLAAHMRCVEDRRWHRQGLYRFGL